MKLKLISALSALAVGGGCLVAIPAILNNTNNVSTQKADNNKTIVTDNIKHSSNVQVVNSVDQIIVESVTNDSYRSSAAIINNNGKQEIYVWGNNFYGQLGLGDTNNRNVPTLLDSSSLGNYLSIKEFTTERANTMVIVNTADGEQTYVWGSNSSGQLGLGNTNNQSSPVLFNTSQFGDFNHIKKIRFGHENIPETQFESSYAILSTSVGIDKIYVWGRNNFGQLGLGDFTNRSIPTLFDTTQFGVFINIKEFDIYGTSYALVQVDANNDKLFLWGDGNTGQLANGSTNSSFVPQVFSSSILNNAKIKFIKFYSRSVFMVLTKNGTDELYSWGYNGDSTLGNGSSANQLTPYRIPQSSIGNANEIIDIKTYVSTFLRVKVNGVLSYFVWGRNTSGELGIGNTTNQLTPIAATFWNPANISEIYASSFDSSHFAVSSGFAYVRNTQTGGDQLYTWGVNNGQLGLGDVQDRTSPTLVTKFNLTTSKIKYFSKYMQSNFIIKLETNAQSEFYTAGQNDSGQIGNGSFSNANVSSFTQILPTRYTKPQSKLINPTTDMSSAQALELINPNNTLNRTELDKYVDTTSFPAGSVLSINPTTTNADYKNGVLNLGITTNQYNDLLIVNTVAQPKTFNVTINGFRPVTDINTNPVTTIIRDADGTNIDKIYDQVVDSTYKVINRNLLEYYFDLSSIPPNAVIHLYRTSFGNDTEATFTLTANQVYDNTGLIINQLYVKSDLVLTLTNQINLALIISLSVVGGLLLVGSIVAIALVKRSSNKLII